MSKASDYAFWIAQAETNLELARQRHIRVTSSEPKPCKDKYETTMAYVTRDGRLALFQGHFESAEALRLAEWLVDTFGPSKILGV